MLAPASFLALLVWSSTPRLPSPHRLHSFGGLALVGPAAFLLAWLLMTGAMMLPSALPLLVAVDRLAAARLGRRHLVPMLAAFGYFLVWGAVGLAIWAANVGAQAFLVPHLNPRAPAAIGGALLVAAGLFGLSPLAAACLTACRQPFGFLARYWSGASGVHWQATRIGLAYGISCVGCCIPMVGLMFVLGMANLVVLIALGIAMVVMKNSRSLGPRLGQAVAMLIVAIGIAMALGWPTPLPHHHLH